MSTGGDFVAALGPSWRHIFLRCLASRRARAVASIAASPTSPPRAAAIAVDTLLDLALESDLDCQFGIPIMNADEDDRRRSCCATRPAIVALSDAGAHVDTLADQGFTTTLLAHWARELGALRWPKRCSA